MRIAVLSFSFLFWFLSTMAHDHSTPQHISELKQEAVADLQAHYATYKKVALDIWNFAEVGFKENKSSDLLQTTIRQQGFLVEAGVAGMSTAFVATYGSGSPVIGLLAEFDALPGLSQDSSAVKRAEGRNSGHGCGHQLFGTGSVAAGIALKQRLAAGKLKSTVKVYGCPAEEGGGGKVYMVCEGLFDGVDAVLDWHPDDNNSVTFTSALAYKSAKFRFYSIFAHASGASDKGRSALDGVESMDYMMNMMREHVPQETRIHYVITNGGKAPNVVPDFAEVFYYVRHPERVMVDSLFKRVVKAAEGAALGTETKIEHEVIDGTHDLLINQALTRAMQLNLEDVGGVTYSPQEVAFAKQLQATFLGNVPPLDSARFVQPPHVEKNQGSTDVGDVSYVVPTMGLSAAT